MSASSSKRAEREGASPPSSPRNKHARSHPPAPIDTAALRKMVDHEFEASVIPTLCRYIEIPNLSPNFDRAWESNGLLLNAARLLCQWVEAQKVPGLRLELITEPGRTPLILLELAATDGRADDAVLMYGHLDKQPHCEGWEEGLGPCKPVRRGNRLYGRGGADDGYSIFSAVLALRALKEQKLPHQRFVVLIEGCEESGSGDLPHYLERLASRIGEVSLIVCLDSGCGDYNRLWLTTSLRGLVVGTLRVRVLREGVHSGAASGVVPSSFRIIRQLLDRVEDSATGRVMDALHVAVPPKHAELTRNAARTLGIEALRELFPIMPGMRMVSDDAEELLLNRFWRPTLCVTGAAGMPPVETAGNVLRAETSFVLSVRLPPTADAKQMAEVLQKTLTRDPPYGAEVSFSVTKASPGWCAPELAPWLDTALNAASREFWAADMRAMGEGGSIPFMDMLGRRFPRAQFVITGVLGPQSNAHGPNEFLHIDEAKGVTCAVAYVVRSHFEQTRGAR